MATRLIATTSVRIQVQCLLGVERLHRRGGSKHAMTHRYSASRLVRSCLVLSQGACQRVTLRWAASLKS
jgi:hypothetical protein